jgi:hypothetical protein
MSEQVENEIGRELDHKLFESFQTKTKSLRGKSQITSHKKIYIRKLVNQVHVMT